jgi:light-regulated signal transduction histidine kinase (bacteriophytochrome)
MQERIAVFQENIRRAPTSQQPTQSTGEVMATVATCTPENKLRLLLLEEKGAGQDPVVWEMDYDGKALPGDPRHCPEKLHEWLTARKIGPSDSAPYLEAQMARKLEELARSNRELEQFAHIASHDLREPLRMVATYTQLLAERYRGKLDKNADQYIDYAADGALRMQALIQDLLALARVNAQNIPNQTVDGNLVMAEVLRDLQPAIRESNAVVQCGKLPVIRASRANVWQVFQNLVSNAIKFRGKPAPEVSIKAVPAGALWQFSVLDNGIGIARESHETIFGVFQRLHTRVEFPGNGVGLAICRKVVETYGGKIWVDSQPGSGSTFNFTLPAQEAQES